MIICLAGGWSAFAQKDESVTPSYFFVGFYDDLYKLVAPNSTMSNLTYGISDALAYDSTAELKESNPEAYFHLVARQKITELTFSTFQEKLGIEIKPLATLNGKIEYKGVYPTEGKFKTVLKEAPGESYYLYYHVSMYENSVGIATGASLGSKVKPTTSITLKIVDGTGKEIQSLEVKEKTDIVVGKTKANLGNLEMGDGEDPDEVITKVLEIYQNALNVLVENYLKANSKQYN